MTQATKHTPAPWYTDNACICASNGRALIAIEDIACEDEDENNAAHIVRCVNAHDELVAALRDCVLQIEYFQGKWKETGSGVATLAQARAAIAKVQK
jgi:hypothetical protein